MKVAHMDKAGGNKRQVGSDIFIVPTDDERLKIVIIPLDVLHNKPDTGDSMALAFQVSHVMKNSEVSTNSKCTELWLPSFKVDGVTHD